MYTEYDKLIKLIIKENLTLAEINDEAYMQNKIDIWIDLGLLKD